MTGGVFWLGSVVSPAPLYPEYPSIGNPLAVPVLSPWLDAAAPVAGVVVLVALVVGAASLVVRFRRARGVERQQLRWLALGGALASVALVIAIAALVLEKSDIGVFQAALGVCVGLLPLATAASILRYRLYDLDRIISRTVAYGVLTLLLGLCYAGAVLLLGQLFGGIGGQPPSWAVAGVTLAVAALFQPARRRVQEAVDRRFNRRRYDGARTVAGFSARLREEIDLDTLTAELLAVVNQTVQPTQASLWLWQRGPPS